MPKWGPNVGTSEGFPLRTRWENPGQSRGSLREDVVYRCNPYAIVDRMEDFESAFDTYEIEVPIFNASEINIISTTGSSVVYVPVPRGGYLLSASIIGKDALTANDTNYLTFTLVNKLATGSGTTAMLAATDANTTKATGGTGLTAVVGRALTVNATAANLRVAEGDVLLFTAAVTSTLANTVTFPILRLRFATLPPTLYPIITRTAGSPLVGPVAGTANGEEAFALDATSEAQVCGFTFNDQVNIPANKGCCFEALVKIDVLPSTNERMIFGLASAYNATFSTITLNAWFRLEASGAILFEADDNTTDVDSQATGITAVAGTYVLLRIDMSGVGAAGGAGIRFFINNNLVGTISTTAAFDGSRLQPICAVQKASGTGVPGFTIDFVRWFFNRV